jgi:hypothetical protein
MIWSAVACCLLSSAPTELQWPIAGAIGSHNQSNYRIWQKIGKKKKTPGIQESLCHSV